MNQIEQKNKLRHRLLQRQIRKATADDGVVDFELLLDLVSEAYSEQDHNRMQHDRALALMSMEMMERNEELRAQRKNMEDLVSRRTSEVVEAISKAAKVAQKANMFEVE